MKEPSWGLRIYFALELLVWLLWFLIDVLSIPFQLEIVALEVDGMPLWIAVSTVINLVMIIALGMGIRWGRGAISRRFDGAAYWSLLIGGILFRFFVGLLMLVWVTTVSGLQSVCTNPLSGTNRWNESSDLQSSTNDTLSCSRDSCSFTSKPCTRRVAKSTMTTPARSFR